MLQIPTPGGQLYFKATIPQLAYEVKLSQMLSFWVPDCIPPVLAIAEEQGWLLTPDSGTLLRTVLQTEADLQHWEQILPIYARLQQNSVQHLNDFLQIGLPDRRLATLPEQGPLSLICSKHFSPQHSRYGDSGGDTLSVLCSAGRPTR